MSYEDMKKVDPKTRLPGVLIDKSDEGTPMAAQQLQQIAHHMQEIMDAYDPSQEMPDWLKSKLTTANEYLSVMAHYLDANPEFHKALSDGMCIQKSEKGINMAVSASKPGISQMGMAHRAPKLGGKVKAFAVGQAKQQQGQHLKDLKAMPKPMLPKSEGLKKDAGVPGPVMMSEPEQQLRAWLKKCGEVGLTKSDAPSESKKYMTVDQGWRTKIMNRHTSGKSINPVTDAGKSHISHKEDIEKLKSVGIETREKIHDKPVKAHGYETYEVHPDGKMKFLHAHYDTSD